MRPVDNYFYTEQSRIKLGLLIAIEDCLRMNNPEIQLQTFAHHLRYIFMVTGADLELPPYPAEQLAQIRSFLEDSYQNPHRAISLTCDEMREIISANSRYRVYNCDNERIVMRHITHPDEECGFINEDLPTSDEGSILKRVLALIPDAKPEE